MVVRGGIVVPWSALPALTALATDPADRDTAAAALEALRGVVAGNAAFAAGQVREGKGARVPVVDCRVRHEGSWPWKGLFLGSRSAHVATSHAGT